MRIVAEQKVPDNLLGRGPRKRRTFFVILFALIFLTSCATFPGRQPAKKPAARAESTVTMVRPPNAPPREVMKPATTDYAAITTPKRQVSMQLVGQAKTFLDQKDYNHARERLEDAISVDPTNGSAYYHLAVVYYNLRDYPKALGFLDQADSLFHASPEWMETIRKFRQLMSP